MSYSGLSLNIFHLSPGTTCSGGRLSGAPGTSPKNAFSKLDFPEPTGPMTATNCPSAMLKGSERTKEGAVELLPM